MPSIKKKKLFLKAIHHCTSLNVAAPIIASHIFFKDDPLHTYFSMNYTHSPSCTVLGKSTTDMSGFGSNELLTFTFKILLQSDSVEVRSDGVARMREYLVAFVKVT